MSLAMWLERARYAPGETIRGFVDAVTAMDAREISVALHYMEQTRDYKGVGLVAASSVLHAGPAAAGQRFEFALTLPPDALPAFRTKNGALWWEVAAHANRPGFDRHTELRIDVVAPGVRGLVYPAAVAVVKQGLGQDLPPDPGWYADPWGKAARRYWDGAAWTPHTS